MKKFYLLLLALIVGASAWAADATLTVSGGSGTVDDPYLISKAADLVEIADACNQENSADCSHFKGVYFKQTADIDMSGVEGFIGIGTTPFTKTVATTQSFQGIYDGDGHKISNMHIKGIVMNEETNKMLTGINNSRSRVGLFGYANGATIQNLTVDATCSVEGYQYVGGIVGYANTGTHIINCRNEAPIKGYQYVGGITGYTYQSSATATTAATMTDITNCVNLGAVTADLSYAGGISGKAQNGKYENCYNEGAVTAAKFTATSTSSNQYGGGITGQLTAAKAINCQNAGAVTVANAVNTAFAGGIAGQAQTTAAVGEIITSCVNLGVVTAISDSKTLGNIVGSTTTVATTMVKASGTYFDKQVQGPWAVLAADADGITGMLTREITSGNVLEGLSTDYWTFAAGKYPMLKIAQTASAPSIAATYFTLPDDETADDFKTQATLAEGVTATLQNGSAFSVADGKISVGNVSAVSTDTAFLALGDYTKAVPLKVLPQLWQGAGTEESPYLIQNKADLLNLAKMCDEEVKHYDGTYFKQTADIDMENDNTFYGIGAKAYTTSTNSYSTYWFSGIYDGNGYAVKNLNIEGAKFDTDGTVLNSSKGSYANVGLFCALGNGAVVKNLTVTGKITGYQNVGGIVGYVIDGATIDNCVNEAEVIGYNNTVGGIAGRTAKVGGQVVNCRNLGRIQTNVSYAGGIVGYNYGSIENCQNDGEVVADFITAVSGSANTAQVDNQYNAGGITAYNSAGTLKNVLNTGRVKASRPANSNAAGIVATNNGKATVTGALNLGNVVAPDVASTCAINSVITTTGVMSGVYYDAQISGMMGTGTADLDGVNATETAGLTAGTALEGLDAEVWDFAAGFYPALKKFNDDRTKDVTSTYLLLPAGETAGNFKTEGTVSTAQDDITASLEDGSVFKLADGKLTAGSANALVTDVLTLTNGDFSLAINLKKLPKLFDGSGTAEDPFLIKTADDFLNAANQLVETNYAYTDEHFLVVNDLNFDDKDFVPLGNTATPFAGNFDGNGKTFKNIVCEYFDDNEDNTAGMNIALFGATAAGTSIKNIKLESSIFSGFGNVAGIVANSNSDISGCEVGANVVLVDTAATASQSARKGENLGAIAAVATAGNISNCVNRANLLGTKYVGGILGYNAVNGVTISDSKNYGNISSNARLYTTYTSTGGAPTLTIKTEDAYVAGIAGSIYGDVTNCQNYGNIYSSCSEAAGIVAWFGNTTAPAAVLSNCQNYGDVEAKYQYGAGIVNKLRANTQSTAKIENVLNKGAITVVANGYVSGIVNEVGNGGLVNLAANMGKVTLKGEIIELTDGSHGYTYTNSSGRAAGITSGLAQKTSSVTNSWNSGDIYCKGQNSAGIVAYANLQSPITGCFNVGNITSERFNPATGTATTTYDGNAGGILGFGKANITNCYNAGTITANKNAAGIVAFAQNGTASAAGTEVHNVYNVGKLVLGDDEESIDASSLGNIFGYKPGAVTYIKAENAYYLDALAREEAACDPLFEGIQSKSAAELVTSDLLGEGFAYNDYAFPMVAGLDTLDAAKAYAAYYLLGEGDTEQNVNKVFNVANLEGAAWTATGGLKVEGGVVTPTEVGEATLTVTAGDFSNTYSFTVASVPAITIPGDLNGDGSADVADVNMLINIVLGHISASEAKGNPDLNGDTYVDVADVNALINLVLGVK